MNHSSSIQPGNSGTSQSDLIKSRIQFCLIFLCFLAPVIIAYLALSTGWYTTRGTSNSGILIEPAIKMESLKLIDEKRKITGGDTETKNLEKSWRLLYVLPETCNETCENRLIQIRQSIPALGPQKNRVKPLLIAHNAIPQNVSQWLSTTDFEVQQTSSTIINQHFADFFQSSSLPKKAQSITAVNANYLYVVDPWGQIILAYPPANSREEWLSSGKAMLKDLKHILKVSRIG